MSQPSNIKDREHSKFVDSPTMPNNGVNAAKFAFNLITHKDK